MSTAAAPSIGDLWHLANTFYSDAAETTPADPTTATLTVRDPNGTTLTVTSSLVHDGTGEYHYDWSPLVGGPHEIRWVGTGAVQVVAPSTIVVRSELNAALVTPEDAMAILGTSGNNNPQLVARLVVVCSEHVQNYCGRRFLPLSASPSAKTFRVRPGAQMINLAPWDFQAADGATVVIDPTGSAQTLTLETDFYIAPENSPYGMADRVMLQWPLQSSQGLATRVDVTATWGWLAVPQPVVQATMHWVKNILTGVSAWPQGAQMDPAEFQPGAEGVVPPAARQLLAPFRHIVAA